MAARPLYCDSGPFEYLSEKEQYDLLVNLLEGSTNAHARELVKTFKTMEFIKHPLAFIELLWLPQREIHQRLKTIIPSVYPAVKKATDPFLKNLKCSALYTDGLGKLSKGLAAALDISYKFIFEHLWNNESDLSLRKLQIQIESRRQQLSNPSPLFLKFIKGILNDSFRKELMHHLSLEAVYRYCGNLISKVYTGDSVLNRIWFDYLSAQPFQKWEKKENYSAYRLIGEEQELLDRKHKLNFFPAKSLRPHDDTVDGYVVHALSFGWFCSQKLTSLSVLTEDPFEKVFERVQQYQIFLAYAQNPLGNTVNASARILHEVQPGTLYSFDRKALSFKIVSFHPVRILEGKPHPQIQHNCSEIEIISL